MMRRSKVWAGVLGLVVLGFGPSVRADDPPPKTIEPTKIKEIEAFMDDAVKVHKFRGTALVALDGKTVFGRGYGLADEEWNVPNGIDTKYRLGSITKTFTSTAVMILVERGKMKLDEPVGTYFDDAPDAWKKVTIRNLLSHTSGIPNFTSFLDYALTMSRRSPPRDTIKRFRDKPLEFEPGSKFAYSNSNYVLLGAIIEKVSGQDYADFLRDAVLKPLGMENTGYDDPRTVVPKRARGYSPWSDTVKNATYIDMTIPHAAGALYSTVEDLAKWAKALSSETLLPDSARKEMLKPVKGNYALGWATGSMEGHKIVGHGGGINGFVTDLTHLPDDKLTVVVLSNSESVPVGRVSQSLARITLGLPVDRPNERRQVSLPTETLDRYVGKFTLNPMFSIDVRRKGEKLFLQATRQPENEIFAEAPGRFFLKVVDAQVDFVEEKGEIAKLILHQNGRDLTLSKAPMKENAAEKAKEEKAAPK